MASTEHVSAATQELIDAETRRLVREAEDIAKRVVQMNRQVLGELANSLVEAETLAGPALDVFLEGVQPWPQPVVAALNGESPVLPREPVAVSDAEVPYDGLSSRSHLRLL